MLGRKQSLKGEPVLADYGPEESLNESADIEWVNKVRTCVVCIRQRPPDTAPVQACRRPINPFASLLGQVVGAALSMDKLYSLVLP